MRLRIMLLCVTVLGAGRMARAVEVPEVKYPVLKTTARSADGFVPKGWRIESQQKGDLNGDRRPDLLLVLRQDSRRNLLKKAPNELGIPELNTNPRILMVAFADGPGSFRLVVQNHELIPRHDDPLVDDPLTGVSIHRGTLKVELHHWANAGTWSTSATKFTFRYQDGCFRLIGYDDMTGKRNTGEMQEVSINFSTRKAKLSLGSMESDKKTTYWKDFEEEPLKCVDEVGGGWDFSPSLRDLSSWGLSPPADD